MTSPARERWWRSRRLRLVLILGMLAMLLAGMGLDIWAGRRVDAEFARLEKRFGSLDGRSVVAPAVDPAYNRARFVKAAAALTIREAPSYNALLASFTRFEKQPESTPVPDDLRAFIASNRDAMHLADEARSRQQSSWGVDYGGGNSPPLLNIRALSFAFYFAALLDINARRPDDAAERVAAGLAVSASMRQEPALLPQLIRISVGVQQCEGLERLITQTEPSRASLEELARLLVDNRAPDPMQMGLLGELRLGNVELMRMESGRVTSPSQYLKSSIWNGPLARIGRPFIRLARIEYLLETERLIQVQGGPRPRPASTNGPRPRFWDSRRLSSSYTRGLERAIDSGDMFNGVLGVTELGVALRRYRLDHGIYPDDIAALIPDYLSRLPIDPVTGQPPAYLRNGAGFTLKGEAVRKDSPANPALEWAVPK